MQQDCTCRSFCAEKFWTCKK